jgi:hypothetical protein
VGLFLLLGKSLNAVMWLNIALLAAILWQCNGMDVDCNNIFSEVSAYDIHFCKKRKKLHGLSPRANYTYRATATCRRSDCQLLLIKGAMWAA